MYILLMGNGVINNLVELGFIKQPRARWEITRKTSPSSLMWYTSGSPMQHAVHSHVINVTPIGDLYKCRAPKQ